MSALRNTAAVAGPPSSTPAVSPSGKRTISEKVLDQLQSGATIPTIARTVGVSEVFVQVMLDHYGRLGLVDSAQSLCSSGSGACGPNGAQTDEAKVACAGCAFAR